MNCHDEVKLRKASQIVAGWNSTSAQLQHNIKAWNTGSPSSDICSQQES